MSKQFIATSKSKASVNLDVLLGIQGDFYVAYCPALELSSYGESEEEAKAAFDEALKIFLADTDKKGTLEKVLLKLGWILQQEPTAKYTPPKLTKSDRSKFNRTQAHRIKERVAIPV